jgi:uncharacterized metal-binding protein YceD (DUF177 family)
MLENYEIDLKTIESDDVNFSYSLDDSFFTDIEAQDISSGHVDAQVRVIKKTASFELHLHVDGSVTIQCDRCLDDMNQPIEADSILKVKFGPSYLDEGDDLIIVPEDEGKINVAWFLYEIIALSIPIQHTHASGECNEEMMKILKEHSGQNISDEDVVVTKDNEVDPRWKDLKKLINNN